MKVETDKIVYVRFGCIFVGVICLFFTVPLLLNPRPLGKSVDVVQKGDKGEYQICIMIPRDSVLKDTNYRPFYWDGHLTIHRNEKFFFKGEERSGPLGTQIISWQPLQDGEDTIEHTSSDFLIRKGEVIKIIQFNKKIK
jgi:hypothetical protein